jgi:hypothetical protein
MFYPATRAKNLLCAGLLGTVISGSGCRPGLFEGVVRKGGEETPLRSDVVDIVGFGNIELATLDFVADVSVSVEVFGFEAGSFALEDRDQNTPPPLSGAWASLVLRDEDDVRSVKPVTDGTVTFDVLPTVERPEVSGNALLRLAATGEHPEIEVQISFWADLGAGTARFYRTGED